MNIPQFSGHIVIRTEALRDEPLSVTPHIDFVQEFSQLAKEHQVPYTVVQPKDTDLWWYLAAASPIDPTVDKKFTDLADRYGYEYLHDRDTYTGPASGVKAGSEDGSDSEWPGLMRWLGNQQNLINYAKQKFESRSWTIDSK
jgi:hypothetical protein